MAPAVCTLCNHYRDSRLCTCLTRRKCTDPFHPLFEDAHRFITETRFFGKDACEEALQEIHIARRKYYATRTHYPIGEPQRIDRDAERLVGLAKGKLYGTAMKMAEQPKRTPNRQSGESNLDLLKKFL